MYRQVLDPVGHSLAWSSLVAALPLITLFVLLGILRMRAWVASILALVVSLVIAVWAYSMPVGQAVLAGSEGAIFGFFPILWIVINAIWIYTMTVETGHFDVLRRTFAQVSDDQRIQAIIIAFSFGALLEALAGFGTPVAITSVMLIAMGFKPLKAAVVALVANTAPVAFGAMAIPIITLGGVTHLSSDTLGAMVGHQTPILAIFVPLVLVFIVDGRRGVSQTWVAALTAGVAFGVAQWITSNHLSVPLTDIVASLFSVIVLVALLRVWQPGETLGGSATTPVVAGGSADEPTPEFAGRVAHPDARGEIVRAWAPYAIIIVVFVLAQIDPIKGWLDQPTKIVNWPGLHITGASGKASTLPQFKVNWLNAAGSLLLISGVLTAIALKVSVGRALRAYWATLVQLRWAIVTVMAVLGLAYVMNASGQTITLGSWMAGAGGFFAFLSPVLGWLGTAVTGSDTSSNSLFGALQVAAAGKAHLDPVLMAASNSSGGVLGKMVSPQNLAIAAAAVGMDGKEGDIFRKVIVWSLIFLAGMCVLSLLQSVSVLSWMVP
ncbi:L-lactate permease [Actinoallomurus bryophytorum]|uniref:L-lactate permease n=1 Tax=Actinoallomurus bryophytorum TaxID=1490222 RepID=A0A543CD40_9ACTN|nr:L-lactate permease [Actinoallomurus bryophytorum]TQL95003.1 lactate permease [Actinoallomurus bryophytorum]